MICYIYKERVLNISDRAYVELSLNSVDTESITLSDCQFLTYAIIGPRGSHMIGIPLYTVVWSMIGWVIS